MSEQEDTGIGRFAIWMVVAGVIVLLDQASKWAIIEWVELYDRVPINSFINITHQRNTGAAFSFLADASGWQRYFFITLASIVSAGITYWIWTERRHGKFILIAGLALILGGAIGNLVDRIALGYVTDFIQVWFGDWAFPSFNVADSAITVGAALLIIDSLFFSKEESGESSAVNEEPASTADDGSSGDEKG
ncbi:MAG: signal peptidase II [Woeseiaceae bacterium]|nr:signal peptidase II [Woeseiaceae bacterium]